MRHGKASVLVAGWWRWWQPLIIDGLRGSRAKGCEKSCARLAEASNYNETDAFLLFWWRWTVCLSGLSFLVCYRTLAYYASWQT